MTDYRYQRISQSGHATPEFAVLKKTMTSKTSLWPICMLTGLLVAAGCDTKDKESQASQAGATAQTAEQPREYLQKPVAKAGDTSIEETSQGTVVRAGDVSVTLPK